LKCLLDFQKFKLDGISILTKILPRDSNTTFPNRNNSDWSPWEADADFWGNHVLDIAIIEITYKFDGSKDSTEPAFRLTLSLDVDELCLSPNTIDVIENFTDKEQAFSRKWRAMHLRPRITFDETQKASQVAYFNFLCRAIIATTRPNISSVTKDLDNDASDVETSQKMAATYLSEAEAKAKAFELIRDRLGEDGFMYVRKRLEMQQVGELG
jgi:hypothetical protein